MASTVSRTQLWLLMRVEDCNLLRNSKDLSMFQDPYVCLQYAGNIYYTPTCTHDWLNPIYRCTAVMPLIEDQREITVTVRSSNTGADDFIARGRIELKDEVLSQGSIYYPFNCSLHERTGRYAGTMDLVLRVVNAQELQRFGPSNDDPPASKMMVAADPAASVNLAAAAPAAAPCVPPISVTTTLSYTPPIGAYPAARAEPFVPSILVTTTTSYPPPIGAYPAAAISIAIPYRAVAAAYSTADPTAPYPASALHPRPMMQYPLRQPYPPPMHPPRPYPPPQVQPPCYPPGLNPGNYPPPPH